MPLYGCIHEFMRTRIAHSVLITGPASSSILNGYHAWELYSVENWVMLFANRGSNHHFVNFSQQPTLSLTHLKVMCYLCFGNQNKIVHNYYSETVNK